MEQKKKFDVVDNFEAVALELAQTFDQNAVVSLWEKFGKSRLYINYPDVVICAFTDDRKSLEGGYIDLLTGWVEYPFKSWGYGLEFDDPVKQKVNETLKKIFEAIKKNH